MKKRIMSLLHAFIFIFSSSLTLVSAQEINSTSMSLDMDVLDVLITAAIYLNSEVEDEDLLPENSFVKEILPLHNLNDNIVAYYITFTSSSYAVVNNNINNLTVIEFGEGDNILIREILDTTSDPYIIYNNPLKFLIEEQFLQLI